jgi:hypothetical protein
MSPTRGSTPRQTDLLSVAMCFWLWQQTQLLPVATTSTARQQQVYVSSDRRPASSQTTRPASAEPARALPIGKNSKVLHSPLPQCREARPATHLLPAESSLLQPERSGSRLRTTGPFQGLHFIGCNILRPQAAGPPAFPTSGDSCVVLHGHAPTSR